MDSVEITVWAAYRVECPSRYPLPNLSLPKASIWFIFKYISPECPMSNVIYSVRPAAEHVASISPEEGAQKSILVKARKHKRLICLFIALFLLEKGFKVAYTIGCKLIHMCLEMGNQSFCNSAAFDQAAFVCLRRKRRKIEQVLIAKSLSPMFSDNKLAFCFYSTFVWINWRVHGYKTKVPL